MIKTADSLRFDGGNGRLGLTTRASETKPPGPPEILTGAARRFVRLIVQNTLLRVGLLGVGHLAVFLLAYWLAFCLRFDFAVPPLSVAVFWGSVWLVLSLKVCIFYASGHFHGWWRYVTFADLASLLRAAVLSLLFISTANYFLLESHIPRSVAIMDCVITIVLIGVWCGNNSGRCFNRTTAARPCSSEQTMRPDCSPIRSAHIRNRAIGSGASSP
jgi:hypothetical protein